MKSNIPNRQPQSFVPRIKVRSQLAHLNILDEVEMEKEKREGIERNLMRSSTRHHNGLPQIPPLLAQKVSCEQPAYCLY